MNWNPIAAVFVALFLVGADACSMPAGWRPLAIEEEMLNAEQILFGEVSRTFPDNTGLSWRQRLYTAEVRVYCIMKGRQTPEYVNITDVGLFF